MILTPGGGEEKLGPELEQSVLTRLVQTHMAEKTHRGVGWGAPGGPGRRQQVGCREANEGTQWMARAGVRWL